MCRGSGEWRGKSEGAEENKRIGMSEKKKTGNKTCDERKKHKLRRKTSKKRVFLKKQIVRQEIVDKDNFASRDSRV